MEQKTVLITGATSGIGLATAKQLAAKGFEVGLLGRNKEKLSRVALEIRSEFPKAVLHELHCNLSEMESVSCAASRIMMTFHQIDVLINNAGGIFGNYQLTKNGIEETVAANHLGHFLLTHLLLPLLIESKTRVINVSSEAHRMAQPLLDDINYKDSYSGIKAYADVKLYNILFTKGLVNRYGQDGIKSYCLHPGVVRTNFAQNDGGWMKWLFKLGQPFLISSEKGAYTSVYLATQEIPEEHNGYYFIKKRPKKPSALARDAALSDQLWDKSLELVKPYLSKRHSSE